MRNNFSKIAIFPLILFLNILFFIGCDIKEEENKLQNLNPSSMDVNSSTGNFVGKEMTKCVTSKGIALDSCTSPVGLRCGNLAGKEYCVQTSDNSSARIWGPY